jgi:peptidoglycan LD-endopeptidase CwlK
MHKILPFLLLATFAQAQKNATIIDSRTADTLGMWTAMQSLAQGMEAQAIRINGKLPTAVATETYRDLVVLEVAYYGFEPKAKLHSGVLVCHKDVAADLKTVFQKMLRNKFPVEKVIPANRFPVSENPADGWNDEAIMQANVTTCFNFRLKTNRTALSLHAEGKAIDINPRINPYEAYSERGKFVHPEGAQYEKSAKGAIADNNIVRYFDALGWQWAGRWTNPVDFQHFQKNKRSKKAFLVGDANWKNYFWIDDATDDFYLYENKRKKEVNQPFCIIYKDERPLLQELFYALDEKNLYILLQQKAQNRFDALPKTTWDYKIKDRNGLVFDQKTLLQAKDYLAILPKNNTANLPLKGVRILLISPLKTSELLSPSQAAADTLRRKLEQAGATVLITNQQKTLGAKEIHRFNPHLSLLMTITNYTLPKGDYPMLLGDVFLLGKVTANTSGINAAHLAFTRLLLTNDFEKSAAFGLALSRNLRPQVPPHHYNYIKNEEGGTTYYTPDFDSFDPCMLNAAFAEIVVCADFSATKIADNCYNAILEYVKN